MKDLRKTIFAIVSLSAGFLLNSCVSNIPVQEYSIARAAYEAAKESGAQRLSPTYWFKAESTYKLGQRLFADREYVDARNAFEESRFLFEKAENASRIASPDGGGLQ